MAERIWNSNTKVIVCGVSHGEVTKDGMGTQRFINLKEALKVFPDLDPNKNTVRFTWAMGNPQTEAMRFETFEAHKFYSS
jgi:hypothetical protein